MSAGTRSILSAVAAAAAIAAMGGGVAQAAPAPAPAPHPATNPAPPALRSTPPATPPAPVVAPHGRSGGAAPGPVTAVSPAPKARVVVPQNPSAVNPAITGNVPGRVAAPSSGKTAPVRNVVPTAPAAAPAPAQAPVPGPGAALPIPAGAPEVTVPESPAPAGGPAQTAPSRPVVLVPTQTGSTTAPAAPTAPATGDKSADAPVQGSVTVPNPIPGDAPSRPLVITPSAPSAGGSTGAHPGVSAGAIDKSAVVYNQHPSPTVTDSDIYSGLLAAGVSPELLPQFTAATRVVIGGESGGSTNAVNRWDSNAWGAAQADGAPHNSSRGVMQTIPSTFAAYHAPGTSASIYDPVANIAAAWRYASARYGVNLQTGAGLDAFMARGTGRGVGY